MIYLFFDTETTGLPKDYRAAASDTDNWPRIVSLSFIVSDGDKSEAFDYIIRPNGFVISKEASDIHGITQEKAEAEGKDLEEVLQVFREKINQTDQIIGHNIEFDRAVVGAEYYRLGLGKAFEERLKEKKIRCTMKETTDFCALPGKYGNKWPKLEELHQKLFGKGFEGAHNSLHDIEATMKCFFEWERINVKPAQV